MLFFGKSLKPKKTCSVAFIDSNFKISSGVKKCKFIAFWNISIRLTDFIYNFILEELDEYKEAAEDGDIVEVLDAFCDIMYVLSAGIMAFGLKDKFLAAYNEVQESNLSKSCATEEEADATAKFRAAASRRPCHFEKRGDKYVVYRSEDRKVQKSLSYFAPNLRQFFTDEELKNAKQ